LAARGTADRESGLLCDGGDPGACAGPRRDRSLERRRRREIARLGRRTRVEGELPCGLRAREHLAVPRRHPSARTGDRAGARLPGVLRAAPAARSAWPARHVLRASDRKSTRLNSSHVAISYAVFCLKKKKNTTQLCNEQNTIDP